MFNNKTQHDCQEFFKLLLYQIHEEANKKLNADDELNIEYSNKNIKIYDKVI